MAAPSARPPGRTVAQTDDAHRLALARHQAAGEAAALRTARHEPESERRRLLADLASRLDALIASLADAPSLWQQRASLARLASELRDCDQPPPRSGAELDALWDETIALLTAFGEGRLPADKAPGPLPHPFWKEAGLTPVNPSHRSIQYSQNAPEDSSYRQASHLQVT